jgi:LuxR family maltose regulon positive regulatory protein
MPLISLGAPAGFGKTTLVAQWRANEAGRESRSLRSRSIAATTTPATVVARGLRPGAGMSPDRRGGHPARLRVTDPEITGEVLPDPDQRTAALPAPVVLVLDDYHVITGT